MSKWYKLDNVAKLFASVSNAENSAVFRVSAILNDDIVPTILQQATDTILKRFPMLTVKLRNGIFWNYLDSNTQPFIIEKDEQSPCSEINPKTNNGYLFKILYYKNRISIEVFHSLTDGSGAIEFFKSLLYYYFLFLGKKIDHEGQILLCDEVVRPYEVEDSFLDYAEPCKNKTEKLSKAYKIQGTPYFEFGNNVVSGVMSASKLNQIAKQNGATITSYLTALLIYSIYQSRTSYSNKKAPIIVAIPVNLRKGFLSRTLRNFAIVVNISCKVTKETTIENLIEDINNQLKEKTEKSFLQKLIYNNVKFESNKYTRFVPLYIKGLCINLVYNVFAEKRKTTTFSNLGNITLPKEMSPHVNRIEAIIYPSKKCPVKCSLCSVNDKLNVSFSKSIVESDILQYFFSYLSQQEGLAVEINSNDWGKRND